MSTLFIDAPIENYCFSLRFGSLNVFSLVFLYYRGSAENGEGGGPYDIYASLPRSLTKKEVFVRSKIEEDENVLKERQSIVRSKTPAELSQIHSFAEVPLPTRVEAWLHKDADGK